VRATYTQAEKRGRMAHIFKILLVDISITVADICSDFFMGEQHGRRNFKDINPLMSSSLVILFGVVKLFGRF
jgi:hypothetical protein